MSFSKFKGRGCVLTAAVVASLLAATPAVADTGGPQMGVGSSFVMSSKASAPTPEEFFGFPIGAEGKLAQFKDIERYLQLLAEQSAEAEYEVAGTTVLGHDQPIMRISSQANLSRIDEILDINHRLADPRIMEQEAASAGLDPDTYARQLAKTSVPVFYLEAGMHSTEVSPVQAIVPIVHRLLTESSEYIDTILNNSIVLVMPAQNPDGSHFVTDYFAETEGTNYQRTYPDLYHWYTGHDNNRDPLLMTQPETRTRTLLDQKYRPVVSHFMHQAGGNSPRIWMPPYDEPLSKNVDPIAIASANSLGLQAQRDLIAEGKPGTKHDDAYGIFYNADVAGYNTFQGGSVYLTEIASGKDLAYTATSENVYEPSGRLMRSPLPYNEQSWSLQQQVDYGVSAAFSGMTTVALRPDSWLFDSLYQVNRNSQSFTDAPFAYVVPAEQRDAFATKELMDLFTFGKVEITEAEAAFSTDAGDFAAGSLILETNQPLGRWVNQLLEIDEYPDNVKKCTNGCPLIMPYSETTDNVGLFFGVDVRPVEASFSYAGSPVTAFAMRTTLPAAPNDSGAYAMAPNSYGLSIVIAQLQSSGIPVYRATAPVTVGDAALDAGAILVPAGFPGAREALQLAVNATSLEVFASDTAPETDAIKLKEQTRIGLIRGMNNMPGGWLMWLMESHGVNFRVVEAADYENLSENFDAILLAPGIGQRQIEEGVNPDRVPERFHWAKGVPGGMAKLDAFAKQGGTVVTLGSSTMAIASAFGLPVTNVAPTDRAVFSAPGALLHQNFDPSVPSAWGMPESWPGWFNNDAALRIDGDAAIASTYPSSGELLASGYAHGTEAIAGAANVATFAHGAGEVTLIASHATFRTWTRAALPLVTNSLYNGVATPLTAEEFAEQFGKEDPSEQLAPSILKSPLSISVEEGQDAVFEAAAGGNPAPTVQWQVSEGGGAWTDIDGAAHTALLLPAVGPELTGNKYRAVFTNALGEATTAAATLLVNEPQPPALACTEYAPETLAGARSRISDESTPQAGATADQSTVRISGVPGADGWLRVCAYSSDGELTSLGNTWVADGEAVLDTSDLAAGDYLITFFSVDGTALVAYADATVVDSAVGPPIIRVPGGLSLTGAEIAVGSLLLALLLMAGGHLVMRRGRGGGLGTTA